MTETMILNIPVNKSVFEQAESAFKKRGLDLYAEVEGFLARSGGHETDTLENGDWTNAEVLEIVSKAYYGSTNNPEEMISLDDYLERSRGRMNG